jgi:sugar O-acyltransferase (sialic acid O-acetyltransferase NeuD family)
MKARPIVVIGGPGSGAIVAEAVRDLAATGQAIELVGFLNDLVPVGAEIAGAPVLGPFEAWDECPADTQFISAIPKPKESWGRYRRIRSLGIPPQRWVTIVHPRAQVARGVDLGCGTYVGPLATVETGARLGTHACVRGGSYISHDVLLGEYVFVGPNACVLGRSKLGDGAYVGANAVCRENVSVGRFAVIGIGAAVIADVAEFTVTAGTPARVIGHVPSDSPEP